MKPNQEQQRVLMIERVIGRCGIVEGAETATARFRIQNPSIRLHLTINCFARPNKVGVDPGTSHNYTNEKWQLFCVGAGTPDVRTNAVFVDPTTGNATTVQLPDSYEGETGVKVLEGEVSLVDNGNGDDDYVVQAIWEPGSGGHRMTDLEWALLTAECDLTTTRPPVTVG